jgi:Conserved hypothetical protein (DUF2461)
MTAEPPFKRRLGVFHEVTQYYDRVHPEIELLQLKQVTALHHCSDQQVSAGDFPEKAVTICRAMKPFLNYLDDILQ